MLHAMSKDNIRLSINPIAPKNFQKQLLRSGEDCMITPMPHQNVYYAQIKSLKPRGGFEGFVYQGQK